MGLKNPIDEEIIWSGRKYHVIGVIKDMIIGSPFEPIKQTIFSLIPDQGIWINIRLNPELNTQEALARIAKVFETIMPAVPFEYNFVDQDYALKFASEERIGKLASFFAVLAIFISCLGLFGMSSYVAEQRKKEIGIRKVLGASTMNLWRMLSIEFVILVIISCIIGMPIAWIFLTRWLAGYAYHTQISAWIFVAVSMTALFITLMTISFHTIKASLVNPIKSLRSE